MAKVFVGEPSLAVINPLRATVWECMLRNSRVTLFLRRQHTPTHDGKGFG